MYYIVVKKPRAYSSWLVASSVSEATNGEGFFDQRYSNNSDVELLLESKRVYDLKDRITKVVPMRLGNAIHKSWNIKAS